MLGKKLNIPKSSNPSILEFLHKISDIVNMKSPLTIYDLCVIDDDGNIYINKKSQRLLFVNQNTYGTPIVSYFPDPLLLLESDKNNITNTIDSDQNVCLVVIFGHVYDTNIEKFIKYIEENGYSVKQIHIPKTYDNIFDLIHLRSLSSFIVGIGIDRLITPIIVGSNIPFYLINPIINKYIHTLIDIDPIVTKLISYNIDYQHLVNKFISIIHMKEEIKSTLSNKLNKLRDIAEHITMYNKKEKNTKQDLIESQLYNDNNFNFYVDCNEHNSWPFSSYMRMYTSFSVDNGIQFDPFVVKSFLVDRVIRSKVWFGSIEVGSMEDIQLLMKNERFLISMTFCIGLFVYDTNIKYELYNLLENIGYNIPICYIAIPSIGISNPFNNYIYSNDPKIANYNLSTGIFNIISLDNKETVKTSDKDKAVILLSSSVVVLTGNDNPIIGIVSYCIESGIPIMLRKSKCMICLLGDTYPLFTERLSLCSIKNFLTIDKVEKAYKVILKLKGTMNSYNLHINNMRLSNIGRCITSMYKTIK